MVTKKKTARRSTSATTYTAQARAIDRRIEKLEDENIPSFSLAAKRCEIQARAVHDVLRMHVPDFLQTALLAAINDAAKSHNIDAPTLAEDETETQAQAIEKLARIFAVAGLYQPAKSDTRKLAESISAILTNPETPEEIYSHLLDGLAVIDDNSRVHENPNYVEAILTIHRDNEKGEAEK